MNYKVAYSPNGWFIEAYNDNGEFVGFAIQNGKIDKNERLAFFSENEAKSYLKTRHLWRGYR